MDEKKPRALRRLDSFSRRQAVFAGAMEVADELRAMTLITRTLHKLDSVARHRTVIWLADLYLHDAPEAPEAELTPAVQPPSDQGEEHLSKEESLRIARAKVLGEDHE